MGLAALVDKAGSDNSFALDVGFLQVCLSLHLISKKARMTSENISFVPFQPYFSYVTVTSYPKHVPGSGVGVGMVITCTGQFFASKWQLFHLKRGAGHFFLQRT